MTASLAAAFGQAVAAKDVPALRAMLHDQIDFRGMTPGRVWEADGPDDVLAAIGTWYDDDDHIEGVEWFESDAFADRERVGYRLRVRNKDGLHLVEQQAYVTGRDGRIGWLRVICSGYRPVSEDLDSDPGRTPRLRAPASTG
jgi:hypothetical protein